MMGILKCRCGAQAEGNTFEQADSNINHGIALSLGNGCDGDPTKMTWDGKPVAIRPLIYLVGDKAKKAKVDETTSKPDVVEAKSDSQEPPKESTQSKQASQSSKPNKQKSKGKPKGQK